jgi:hypothetical protein
MRDLKYPFGWWLSNVFVGSILILLIGTVNAAAPATIVHLPPTAVQVASKVSSERSQKAFRVSAGGDLEVSHSSRVVLVEAGGQIRVSGNGNTLFLEPKAVCSVTGRDNVVHIMPGAMVKLGPGNAPRFATGYQVVLNSEVEAGGKVASTLPGAGAVQSSKLEAPVAAMPAPLSTVPPSGNVRRPPAPGSGGLAEPPPSIPMPGVAGSDPPGVALARVQDSPPPTVSKPPEVMIRVREKFAPLATDPLIATMPLISELLELLPMPEDPIPSDATQNEGLGGDSSLHGMWVISSIELANAPGGVAPQTKGAVDFWADGTGTMKVSIDVIGQTIERRGWFQWSAKEATLEINPKSGRQSKWKRQATADGEQEAVMVIGGNEVKMRLKRGTESASQ